MTELITGDRGEFRELTDKEIALRIAMLEAYRICGPESTIRPTDIFVARGGDVDPEDYGFLYSVVVGHAGRAVNHGVLLPVTRNNYVMGYRFADDENANKNFLNWG